MERLSFILPKILKKRGFSDEALAGLVLLKTKEWIHREFPAYTVDLNPVKFDQGIVLIEAAHSIALSECQANAESLKRHLTDLPWGVAVESVRVVRSRS